MAKRLWAFAITAAIVGLPSMTMVCQSVCTSGHSEHTEPSDHAHHHSHAAPLKADEMIAAASQSCAHQLDALTDGIVSDVFKIRMLPAVDLHRPASMAIAVRPFVDGVLRKKPSARLR